MWDPIPYPGVDYDEVFRHGGDNCGNEEFDLFKCPHCGRIYLLENELFTVYVDGSDLSRRISALEESFDCLDCGHQIPTNEPWTGPRANIRFRVTWDELETSEWTWICKRPSST